MLNENNAVSVRYIRKCDKIKKNNWRLFLITPHKTDVQFNIWNCEFIWIPHIWLYINPIPISTSNTKSAQNLSIYRGEHGNVYGLYLICEYDWRKYDNRQSKKISLNKHTPTYDSLVTSILRRDQRGIEQPAVQCCVNWIIFHRLKCFSLQIGQIELITIMWYVNLYNRLR